MSNSTIRCVACGAVSFSRKRGVVLAEYKGRSEQIGEAAHYCTTCESSVYLDDDIKDNRRSWIRFKKDVDSVPLGFEIREMRTESGLTQSEAAALFGGGPVSFSKYENDDLVPDEAMVNLLRLAIAYPDTISRLVDLKRQITFKAMYSYFAEATQQSMPQDAMLTIEGETVEASVTEISVNLPWSDRESQWKM